MSALEELAVFVAGRRPDERDRAAIRLHVADTVGAWIAGAATGEGRALRRFRAATGGGLDGDVAMHCGTARLSEIDDIHLAAMVTPGAIVVPAALAVAAASGQASADDLAAAILAGYEAMIRLGASIDGPAVLYRGIWPTYFATPFGVAAVAARLWRLDATQAAHALAHALIMAAPGTGHHAAPTTVRWLAVGQAAARGLVAARAAQSGFTSDLRIAEGEFLKGIYGVVPNAGLLGQGFGTPALHQVAFKPWCAARQTMAATQALKEIVAEEGVAPDSILAIEAAVLPPHLKMIGHGVAAGDRFSQLTSLPYNMAVAVLAPERACDLAAPPDPPAPVLADFMARITVRGDEALLSAGYPAAWPARVAVTTAAGRRERTVSHVPGDPARPYGEAELRAKFARVTAAAVADGDSGALFEHALAALEQPGAALAAIAATMGAAP